MLAFALTCWPCNAIGAEMVCSSLSATCRHPRARQIGEDHQKLIAAEPRHHVGLAQHFLDAPGHLFQQGVAHVVPERIVDGLEIVRSMNMIATSVPWRRANARIVFSLSVR